MDYNPPRTRHRPGHLRTGHGGGVGDDRVLGQAGADHDREGEGDTLTGGDGQSAGQGGRRTGDAGGPLEGHRPHKVQAAGHGVRDHRPAGLDQAAVANDQGVGQGLIVLLNDFIHHDVFGQCRQGTFLSDFNRSVV